jgi:hypothetical protein
MEKTGMLGLLMMIAGVLLIANFSVSKITGNVIGENVAVGTSSLGFILLIAGIALFIVSNEGGLEKTLAQKVKESGKMVDSPNELIRIARKSGYRIGEEVKEGTKIYDFDGRYITVIPRRHISPGTYHGIIKTLAKGEPEFRKRL